MMKTKMILMALFVPMLLNAQVFDSSTKATTAQTNYGKVAGYIDRNVFTYKGIPYAKAGRFLPSFNPFVQIFRRKQSSSWKPSFHW